MQFVNTWSTAQRTKQKENLARLISGAYVFCAGMMIMVLANRFVEPSIQQEWLALAGLVIVILGGLRALHGHIGLSIAPVLSYFFRDPPK